MVLGRYLTHAVVLLVAMVISGFASVDRNLPASFALRLGAVNAEGLVGSEGGSVGKISLGRTSTIIKPVAVPTSAVKPHTSSVYTVGDGERHSPRTEVRHREDAEPAFRRAQARRRRAA